MISKELSFGSLISRSTFFWSCSFALTVFACTNLSAITIEEDGKTETKKAGEDPSDLDKTLQGHSYHGEVFNEGPRQKAYLMGGTGKVNFPVTTDKPHVQDFINQGVGQLYGFWYLEAERSFRQAIALDKDCAIAYWGASLANRYNAKRSRAFIDKAMERLEKVSEREKMYIKALNAYLPPKAKTDDKKSDDKKDSAKKSTSSKDRKARSEDRKRRAEKYTSALEDIVFKHPEDLEAKAFLALQLYDNRRQGVPIVSYYAVDGLLETIFKREPLHSAHHFEIHLWDTKHPELALESAAKCGPASPSIAHMWHMPGHIYSRLKRYEDAVWQQEASARVDHAHMMRDQVMPDEIGNFAHNNEWLIRNLVFIGKVDAAIELAKNMIELPQHPKYNSLTKQGSYRYGRLRLFEVLTKFERWDKMVELCDTEYLDATDNETEQIKRLRYFSAGLFMTGKTEEGQKKLELLESRLKKIETEIANETKTKVSKLKEKLAGLMPPSPPVPDPSVKQKSPELKGEAKKLKSEIDKKEKEIARKFNSRKSRIEKAINSAKGFLAYSKGEFKAAYDLLKKSGEEKTLVAELRFLSGEKEKALEDLKKEMDRRKNEVIPAARYAFLLHKSGDKEKSKEIFEALRSMSTSIDLGTPMFSRLAPLAAEYELGEKWLKKFELAKDIGQRPDLDSLGPFTWGPPKAPEWVLFDQREQVVSTKDFAGKPVIMIFYLGSECLHCAEQLQAFNPKAKDFEDAGIDLIAISSDKKEGLIKSIDSYDGKLNIPLVSDENLEVFKRFRAFDDFENQPLHGTFLIDSKGKIRWQDIGYEPFMDHEFLLKESQRLLKQSPKN